MAGKFDSTKVELFELLKDIRDGTLQLPDFQRGWVWDDDHVKSLLASISLSFPIGTVMLLQTGNPSVRFKPRPVEGASASDESPEYLILDGQQRLTSLFQALFMDGPVKTVDAKGKQIWRWYYFDLDKALDPNLDREEAVVGVPPDRALRSLGKESVLDLSTTERECLAGLLPVSVLFDYGRLTQWQLAYIQVDAADAAERLKRWNQVAENVVIPFQKYQLPQILLGKDTPKEAVCKVFEKVNTGGVSLTVFELLAATYAADDFSLRDDWAQRRKMIHEHRVLQTIDSTDFLQSISLLSTLEKKRQNPQAAVSCKRKDILDLPLDEYQRWSDAATHGYLRAAQFLFEEKIYSSRDLPYRTQIIPMAAIFAVLGSKAEQADALFKLRRWFWCGILGELYGGSIESRFARDLPQFVEWVGGYGEPDTVTEANFLPIRLRTLRSRLSAAFKGIYALLLRNGAADFASQVGIDAKVFFEDRIDIHHIFPMNYCKGRTEIDDQLADSVLNKTPLSAASNQFIRDKAPDSYLHDLQKKANVSEADMDKVLATHAIDPASLRANDFAAFIKVREAGLIDLIEDAMGKPVIGPASLGTQPFDASTIKEGEGSGSVLLPDGIHGALIVEGNTDEQYLRIACDTAGQPSLLDGIHIVVGNGVNGVVQQMVLLRAQTNGSLPVVSLLDKDTNGKAARDSLISRFGMPKSHVITYAEVFPDNPDEIEAEDLLPAELLQRFIEEFGENNVLAEKKMHSQMKKWHYGFNAAGKDAIGQFLSENMEAPDAVMFVRVWCGSS